MPSVPSDVLLIEDNMIIALDTEDMLGELESDSLGLNRFGIPKSIQSQ
jgi:hypothetical protein